MIIEIPSLEAMVSLHNKLTVIVTLQEAIAGKSILESLIILAAQFPNRIAFSSSLGLEDQAITHFIFANNLPIRVFTLDTGRQFYETYSTLRATEDKYQKKVAIYFPESQAVEKYVAEQGINGFYHSPENRKECCRVRKIEPLRRALKDVDCWITGLRAEQSDNRQNMQAIEWDGGFNTFKYNPLLDWTWEELRAFIKKNNIPYNSLHDKGFVSIGCAPCTRAIQAGDSFRAGRWWWEDNSKKECGLHEK
jgi:phosphoadenosine phosphosulfate reductase